jgi:hypothetical protein
VVVRELTFRGVCGSAAGPVRRFRKSGGRAYFFDPACPFRAGSFATLRLTRMAKGYSGFVSYVGKYELM